ncbi:MAG: hypothetical protein JXA93_10305 [Anaerolineae bacterium]|nr:hypothetical protein [Anaerolineae bacterium]
MSNKQRHEDRAAGPQERIARLEHEIEQLKARLPKHSTPPAMIIELEELEDELEALHAALRTAPSAGVKRGQE